MKSIFKKCTETPIYVTPIYPTPVYQLFSAAIKKSRELRYARPVVRNLCVFMRPTTKDLIPVSSLAKLNTFKPRNWQPTRALAPLATSHSPKNTLRIGHVNIDRLRTHFNELEAHCHSRHYDLIAITETFLSPALPDVVMSSVVFSFTVMIESAWRRWYWALRSFGLQSQVNWCFSPRCIRFSRVCYFLNYLILFAIVYRPPKKKLPINFLNNLSQYSPLYSHVIVTSDFNINMSTVTDESAIFTHIFSNKVLSLIDSPPTHHTLWKDNSSLHTWLDLFLVKDMSRVSNYSKSDAPFAYGHDFIRL